MKKAKIIDVTDNANLPQIQCVKENYFGKALREIREEKGLTQEEASRSLSITQAQWSAYEVGKSRPNIDTIVQIAHALGIGPLDLMNRSLSKSKYLKGLSLEDLKQTVFDEIQQTETCLES